MVIGDRIGHIRIEERIGSGGMGEVFRGFDERLLRRVAVKALASSAHVPDSAKARFLREAQLLSKLDHPNICRIYDLVESEHGDVLILELVDGRTLGEAIRNDLSREEKLHCARGIAEALAAAHRRGIIHRDLKPDNVMVVGKGQVKVLDFGIARLLHQPQEDDGEQGAGAPVRDPDPPPSRDGTSHADVAFPSASTDTEDPMPETEAWNPSRRPIKHQGELRGAPTYMSPEQAITQRGLVVGTLAYMSPEQADGTELNQASDMYSLGILLQELFTESPAYDPAPTPEAKLIQVASGRSRPVEGIDPDIARLIENLKEIGPDDRPTAEDTVARLDWIRQRPVRARRRRLATLAGLGVMVAVAITAIVSMKLARPRPLLLPGQQGRVLVLPFVNATGDPHNDWVRHGLMELVAQTLDASEGISVVDPADAAKALEVRGLTTAAELPPDEILRILDGVGSELGLAVRLERTTGRFAFLYTTYNVAGSVGEHRLEADELTAGANLLARRIAHRLRPDAPFVEVLDRFSDQPFVNQLYAMGVEALHGSGAAAAHPYFEVTLHRDPNLQWARIKLADCLEILGDGEGSQEAAFQVLENARSTGRPDLERAALLQLALLMRRTGEYDASRGYYRQVLELAHAREDRIGTADALRGLGAVTYFEGDLDQAQEHFEEAMALYRELGDRTGEMYCIGNLSAAADAGGDTKRAEALDTQALEIARKTGNLKGIADYLNNLGVSARNQDQFARAEELYRESLELQRRLGNRHGEANTLHNLGDLAKDQGRTAEATDHSRKALAIFETLDDHVGIARSSANLAELLLLQGRIHEARAPLERALAWNPDSPVVVSVEALLAYREGRFADARMLQEQAKNTAGESWRPIRQARLEAFKRAQRLGHPVPLPLEEP